MAAFPVIKSLKSFIKTLTLSFSLLRPSTSPDKTYGAFNVARARKVVNHGELDKVVGISQWRNIARQRQLRIATDKQHQVVKMQLGSREVVEASTGRVEQNSIKVAAWDVGD